MSKDLNLIEVIARGMCVRNAQYECVVRHSCTEATCTEWRGFGEEARAALLALEKEGHVVVGKDLLSAMAECVRKLPGGVWEVWTSNSYRRITANENGRSGPDGGVLHALTHRADGHPDLSMTAEELWALCALRNHVLAMLAAAPKATEHTVVPKDDGWQPIDAAPKDGTQIDLWCQPQRGQLTSGSYGRVPDCWFYAEKWWRLDLYEGDDQCRREVHNVTHWMPRPSPPAAPKVTE